MAAELTGWFPPGLDPVRVGPYQTCAISKARPGYSAWYGSWGLECPTPEEAIRQYSSPWARINQRKSWRGLATDPHLSGANRTGTAVHGASVRPKQPAVCAVGHGELDAA